MSVQKHFLFTRFVDLYIYFFENSVVYPIAWEYTRAPAANLAGQNVGGRNGTGQVGFGFGRTALDIVTDVFVRSLQWEHGVS